MNEIERVYVLFILRKWWSNKYCYFRCCYLIVMCCDIISCWNIMLEDHAAGSMIQLLIYWSSFRFLKYSLPFGFNTSGWECYITKHAFSIPIRRTIVKITINYRITEYLIEIVHKNPHLFFINFYEMKDVINNVNYRVF